VRPARLALATTLGLAVALGACTYFREPAPYRPSPTYRTEYPTDADTQAVGRRLYQRDCAFCHGDEAEGTSQGPDLTTGANGPALTDFMVRTGRMPIDDPDEPTRRRASDYDEREIDALVAYLDRGIGQTGPGIPVVDPSAGETSRGQSVYQEDCAACHATTGIGGAMLSQRGGTTSGIHIPDLSRSDPTDVAEAVRTGPGAMPRFGPGVIDEDELDDLTRYVEYLHDPDDRGGWPIGRIGPVAEGAIGWILGLGIIVAFIRWVGTKRGELR
jgi:ubiquinol-cytochrome c reductase cytochrome c subunit